MDCDDTDPTRHPGAHDTCEDTVDQDCDGADRACEARALEDADAVLFGPEARGLSSAAVVIVGAHVVAAGGTEAGGALLVSAPTPRGVVGFEEAMVGSYVGEVAALGDDEIVATGTTVRVLSIYADREVDARLWYVDDAGDSSGSTPTTGQLVGGDDGDVVFASAGRVLVLDGSGAGAISTAACELTLEGTSRDRVVAGDGDGDGFDELVVVGNAYTTAYIFQGPLTGTRTLDDADFSRTEPYFYATKVGDIDGDGLADLGGSTGDSFRIFSLSGGGVAELASFPTATLGLGVGDVNGDGRGDLLASHWDPDTPVERLRLHRGPVSGAVEEKAGQVFSHAADASVDLWVDYGDLDGDGLSDFTLGLFAPDPSYVANNRAALVFYGAAL